MSLIVQFSGGFGNKLFQTWPGYYLASKLGLVFLSKLIHRNSMVFVFGADTDDLEEILRLKHRCDQITFQNPDDLERIISQNQGRHLIISSFYNENAVLAQHYADFIRDLFTTDTVASAASVPLAAPVSTEVVKQIAIHMRLGDLTDYYQSYRLGYFNMVKTALAKYPDWPVVIVSEAGNPSCVDEMMTVIKNFGNRVITTHSKSYLEDFYELTRSAVIVSSNSTFTWWAAFLSRGLVEYWIYLPKRLFNNVDGLYLKWRPDNWTVVRE